MKITILGCGGSMGVPHVGGNWGACNPNNPKNYRLRSSILLQKGNTNLLIDSGPDLRQQLLNAHINHLDAVLYSHAHADHIHGLNDLRPLCLANKKAIPIYSNAYTLEAMHKFFPLAFIPPDKDTHYFKLHLTPHTIDGPFSVGPFDIRAFNQDHGGHLISLGFHINNMAYSTDVRAIDPETLDTLKDKLDLWIVDCYRRAPHPTHAHLEQTLDWIQYVKPKQAILTHMSEDLDYEELKSMLPGHILPAYDGLIIQI